MRSFCARCGLQLQVDDRFCPKCGQKVSGPPAVQAITKPPREKNLWASLASISVMLLIGIVVAGLKSGAFHWPNSLDGTYVLEDKPEYEGRWAKIKIHGAMASMSFSDGSTASAFVEQIGSTVKMKNYQSYKNGYIEGIGGEGAELWKSVDNGQALEHEVAGGRVKFIKL